MEKILDTEVVDIERKGDLSGGVVPEVGSVVHGIVAIRG